MSIVFEGSYCRDSLGGSCGEGALVSVLRDDAFWEKELPRDANFVSFDLFAVLTADVTLS